MTGSPLVYALSSIAAGSALALSRSRREHRLIAALLAGGLAADVVLEWRGLPFAAGVVVGTAYPWAAWGVVRQTLHVRRRPSLARRVGTEGSARPPAGVAEDGRGIDDDSVRSDERAGAEVGRHDAEKARAHLPILLAFLAYVSALLLSGLRGPSLAWCYAVAQGGIAGGMGWEVRRWRKDERRRGGGPSAPSLGSWVADPPGLSAISRSTARRTPSRVGPVSQDLARPKMPTRSPYASRPLSATVACALVVAATEIANAGGPYLGLPEKWYLARIAYAMTYGALTLIQIGALSGWMRSTALSQDGRA